MALNVAKRRQTVPNSSPTGFESTTRHTESFKHLQISTSSIQSRTVAFTVNSAALWTMPTMKNFQLSKFNVNGNKLWFFCAVKSIDADSLDSDFIETSDDARQRWCLSWFSGILRLSSFGRSLFGSETRTALQVCKVRTMLVHWNSPRGVQRSDYKAKPRESSLIRHDLRG